MCSMKFRINPQELYFKFYSVDRYFQIFDDRGVFPTYIFYFRGSCYRCTVENTQIIQTFTKKLLKFYRKRLPECQVIGVFRIMVNASYMFIFLKRTTYVVFVWIVKTVWNSLKIKYKSCRLCMSISKWCF